MQPDDVRLAIDYGAACTQAVVAWPDGRWEPLPIDGAWELPSAVHTGAPDGVLVGQAAWRQAIMAPDGFVASPLTTLAGPDGDGGDGGTGVAALAAATLRRVAAAATERVGEPVTDVRLVVPAGWGPRRRTWLRRAAYQAGLGQPRLVEAPVAATNRLLAVGQQIPVGAFLLVVDLGAGCEASVLRRGPTGIEVLSTLADREAGGTALDTRVTTALAAPGPPAPDTDAPGAWWAQLAALRQARESLSQQPVVQVPMPPPTPALVLHSHLLDDLAEPVLQRAADLAVQAVAAAEISVEQLAGGYLIGGTAAMPAAASRIGARLGTRLQMLHQPAFAAALGAADAGVHPSTAGHPSPAATAAVPAVPRVRRLTGIVVPAVVSLILYAHMVSTANFNNGTPAYPTEHYYVLAVWDELSLAGVYALVACLAAGTILGGLLAAAHHRDGAGQLPVLQRPGGQVAAGIVVAVTTGLAIAALYGLTAAVLFALPVARLLRWSLMPALPTAVVAVGLVWAARRRIPPPRGWDAYLAFPISSIAFTTVGLLLVTPWWHGPIPPVLHGWWDAIARVGGMLMGIGIACTVARHPALRTVLGVVMAGFGMVLVGRGPVILSITYTLAVALWWAYRLWLLLRLTPTTATAAHPGRHATTPGPGGLP